MNGDFGYNVVKAQAQRDAIKASDFTLKDILKHFRGFSDEFKNAEGLDEHEGFTEDHGGNIAAILNAASQIIQNHTGRIMAKTLLKSMATT